jgi:hypothetical protein
MTEYQEKTMEAINKLEMRIEALERKGKQEKNEHGLLPCPFCAEKNDLQIYGDQYFIFCKTCKIETKTHTKLKDAIRT